MQLISMQLITWFLLSVIDIFSKYAWVIRLKDKNGITITNAINESGHKPNKIWVEKNSQS